MNTSEDSDALPIPVHEKYGKPHAFTLAVNPQCYNSHDPVAQYEQLLACVFRHKPLRRCLKDYVFYPEMTKQGNIHLHGIYYIKNKYDYFRWFLPACKRWGYVLVKNRDVNIGWEKYIEKDLADMKDLLYCDTFGQRMPVPIDKYTLKDYHVPSILRARPNLALPKKPRRTKITDYFK